MYLEMIWECLSEHLASFPERYAWSFTKFGLIDLIPKHASILAEIKAVVTYRPSVAGVPDGVWVLMTWDTSNWACFWRQFSGEGSRQPRTCEDEFKKLWLWVSHLLEDNSVIHLANWEPICVTKISLTKIVRLSKE